MFALVEEVFRRVPNVAYKKMVRLRRSLVKDFSLLAGLCAIAPVPQSACHGGVSPPVFWMQIPCFLEVTGMVALHNLDNKEVPCKILQDKELRAVSASAVSFRLKSDA